MKNKGLIVFVTGGVMSSLGKGITASTLGALLKSRGLSVRLKKFDPYLNVDPGTMSPYQHGEVFVTEDGAEVDLDFGSYERFTDVNCSAQDSTTTGKIYKNVIEQERLGTYLGQTIQVVPHITQEIKKIMTESLSCVDVTICEIGGTVGDMEGLPYLEAVRQIRQEKGATHAMVMHLGWVPFFAAAGELKTKPLQHSVKELQRCGIQPDFLICRCDRQLPDPLKEKLSLFCNVPSQRVIEAYDVSSIYQAPLFYHKAGLDTEVCAYFNIHAPEADLSCWEKIIAAIANPENRVNIGIVGKYVRFPDTYRSLIEALYHGGFPSYTKVNITLIDAESLVNQEETELKLHDLDGIVVPGGFGVRGAEGMITAIKYARTKKIPFLGICFGMQLAVIESLRNLPHLEKASSSEFGSCDHPVIAPLLEWMDQGKQVKYNKNMGGTMRLGSYDCTLDPESLLFTIYGSSEIKERHRHRYEVNGSYISQLTQSGLSVSGMHNNELVECIERKDHPWFIGTQFHPELKSRPFAPHPLFISFINGCLSHNKQHSA